MTGLTAGRLRYYRVWGRSNVVLAARLSAASGPIDLDSPRTSSASTRALRLGHRRATIVAMGTESLRQVRDHLSEVVDRVEHEHERVTLTRNGRPAAVLISPDDLAQLEETLEVLGDPEALAEIREADAAYARGDVVRGVEAVRALRR